MKIRLRHLPRNLSRHPLGASIFSPRLRFRHPSLSLCLLLLVLFCLCLLLEVIALLHDKGFRDNPCHAPIRRHYKDIIHAQHPEIGDHFPKRCMYRYLHCPHIDEWMSMLGLKIPQKCDRLVSIVHVTRRRNCCRVANTPRPTSPTPLTRLAFIELASSARRLITPYNFRSFSSFRNATTGFVSVARSVRASLAVVLGVTNENFLFINDFATTDATSS